MISAWWLILIIPTVFISGYCLCGVLSSSSERDRCFECRMNKEKSE